jgi:hypothetical protein
MPGVNALAYLASLSLQKNKKIYKIGTCDQSHKYFTHAPFEPSKISCTVPCVHAPVHCCQNAPAYFCEASSYRHKMIMKLTLGANFIKLFLTLIYKFKLKAREFVSGQHFHPSLMFAGKARVTQLKHLSLDLLLGSLTDLTHKH